MGSMSTRAWCGCGCGGGRREKCAEVPQCPAAITSHADGTTNAGSTGGAHLPPPLCEHGVAMPCAMLLPYSRP